MEIKLKDQFAISVRKHRIKLQRDHDEVSSEVEMRYSKAMVKEREQWSLEFKEMMGKCEEDAVKLRQDHDQALVYTPHLLLMCVYIFNEHLSYAPLRSSFVYVLFLII